jgi:periplasmic copper chaperone A
VNTHRFLLAAALSLLAMASAAASAAPTCQPHVRDGWIRMTPGGMGMLAGYARLDNPCRSQVVVTGARSTAFADVSLHETRIVDAVSRMRPVPRLALAPGQRVDLAPGGLHLMLMQPTGALAAGDHIAITFNLADGRRVSGDFVLRPMTP